MADFDLDVDNLITRLLDGKFTGYGQVALP